MLPEQPTSPGYTPVVTGMPIATTPHTPTTIMTPTNGVATNGGAPRTHAFIGTADVNAATAKMRLVQIAEEIISLLASDPQATVHVSVEISADFPGGVSDQLKRAVSENATGLGFKNKTWE